MTQELAKRLAEAKALVTQLEQQLNFATCEEIGEHDWVSIGGCNAGCSDDCVCSVPVNECSRCHDCDYGNNEDARDVRKRCAVVTCDG